MRATLATWAALFATTAFAVEAPDPIQLPPPGDCTTGYIGMELGTGCVQIGFLLDGAAGWQNDIGAVAQFDNLARLTAVQQTAVGTLVGVLTVEGYGTQFLGESKGGFDLLDAYVVVGDVTTVTVGYLDPDNGSLADFGDDLPFTHSGTLWAGSDGLVPLTKGNLGGLSIQLRSELAPGLTAGLALENIIEHTPEVPVFYQNLYPPAPVPGTLVGVVAYDSGILSGHATATVSGLLDEQIAGAGVHAALTADFDTYGLMVAATVDDSSYWDTVFSGYAKLGALKAAVDLTATYLIGESVDASIEYHLTDALSVGVQRRETFTDDPLLQFWQNTLFAEVQPLEGWTLGTELHHYNYSGIDEIYAFRAKASYRSDDLEISGSVLRNSVGAAAYDLSLSRAIVD